jgi:hypothetical protein
MVSSSAIPSNNVSCETEFGGDGGVRTRVLYFWLMLVSPQSPWVLEANSFSLTLMHYKALCCSQDVVNLNG